jgi:hypothetical protein
MSSGADDAMSHANDFFARKNVHDQQVNETQATGTWLAIDPPQAKMPLNFSGSTFRSGAI